MERKSMSAERIFLTVDKYFKDGKTNRILIKSPEGNYFLDFNVNSFVERSLATAGISIAKVFSIVSPTFQMSINKFNLKEG